MNKEYKEKIEKIKQELLVMKTLTPQVNQERMLDCLKKQRNRHTELDK